MLARIHLGPVCEAWLQGSSGVLYWKRVCADIGETEKHRICRAWLGLETEKEADKFPRTRGLAWTNCKANKNIENCNITS